MTKSPTELSLDEARAEVAALRSVLAGNEHLAPKRVPELMLIVRADRIKVRLAQGCVSLGAVLLPPVYG